MKEDRYAARAARLLREARRRITPQRTSSPDRAIAALGQTISRAARRRRQRGLLVAGASVALCAAAVLLVLHSRLPAPVTLATTQLGAGRQSGNEGGAEAQAQGRVFVAGEAEDAIVTRAGAAPRSLAAGQFWHSGERLRTDAEPLQLSTSDGSTVRVGAASDLELLRADDQRWLRLAAGTVWVHVAKLKAGERFVVVTPDAEVEVRGTRFQVDVVPAAHDCGGGTVTRVKVQEGVVQVRGPDGDARVLAGDRWPARCPGFSSPAVRPTRIPVQAAAPRSKPMASSPELPSASTLATENDLFSSALRAERQGNPHAAVELLDLLLRRFPRSPLTASAAAARDRLSASAPAR